MQIFNDLSIYFFDTFACIFKHEKKTHWILNISAQLKNYLIMSYFKTNQNWEKNTTILNWQEMY